MLDMQQIGQMIQSCRRNAQLSQDELAEKLYLSRQAISRWEMGLALPSIDNIVELTKIFNISFEELLCLNEQIELDPNDIFNGHNRRFIVKSICENELKVNLPMVFNQFTVLERLEILVSILNNQKEISNELLCLLTTDEKKLINKR